MGISEIWDSYHDDVNRFVMSKVKDEIATDDLVQDIFIKAQTKLDTLREQEKAKSWLLSIARNTVIDYFRKKKEVIEFSELDYNIVAEEKAEHTEKDCLPGIIKSLPKKYRDPLFLSDIKGMKQKEIAIQLKLPLATVKSQIQRARRMIAQSYMDCCDYKINDKGFLVGEVKDRNSCKMCSD